MKKDTDSALDATRCDGVFRLGFFGTGGACSCENRNHHNNPQLTGIAMTGLYVVGGDENP
jgi:hypothetical protein